MPTERFGFPYIAADQAQKHVTHNAALDMLDATLGGIVASATTTTAPGSPIEGEAYIVPAGASGFAAAVAGDVAIWSGATLGLAIREATLTLTGASVPPPASFRPGRSCSGSRPKRRSRSPAPVPRMSAMPATARATAGRSRSRRARAISGSSARSRPTPRRM